MGVHSIKVGRVVLYYIMYCTGMGIDGVGDTRTHFISLL